MVFRLSETQKTLPRCRVFLLPLGCWLWSFTSAQSFSTQPTDGERLDYVVTYEWGPFYLEVGDVSFTTTSMAYSETQLWSFEGWGASRKHWNWFYPVNSIYASVANASLTPLNFQRKGREGGHSYDRWYFLEKSLEIKWISADAGLDSGSISHDFDTPVHDVMTAVHHCRHLPWEDYQPGDTVGLNLILDGAIHHTRIDFKGRTRHEDPTTKTETECWEFSPTLIDGTVFKAGDQMRVVVTADERRLPIFVETELVVGRARIYLTGVDILEAVKMGIFRHTAKSKRDAFFKD